METKQDILSSEKKLQEKKDFYQLTNKGFMEYKKFLSNPHQKKFCFKGYFYIEITELENGYLQAAIGRIDIS